ncbi:MAG TPA: phosphoglycerate mutase family protein [Anaerolineae bacterium]|nr:phosphoglycerate mutase family protein [Anaerolineae bacterium]
MRHGESTVYLLHEFADSGCRHPLTERGIEQACALARGLGNLGIDRVYSSPLMRAVQTAETLAETRRGGLYCLSWCGESLDATS